MSMTGLGGLYCVPRPAETYEELVARHDALIAGVQRTARGTRAQRCAAVRRAIGARDAEIRELEGK